MDFIVFLIVGRFLPNGLKKNMDKHGHSERLLSALN